MRVWVLICLLAVSAAEDGIEVSLLPPLPVCEQYQACAAEVRHFPVLSESTDDPSVSNAEVEAFEAAPTEVIDGSGAEIEVEGSGGEGWLGPQLISLTPDTPSSTAFPLYDEFVTSPGVFDFAATPNITQRRLCRCSDSTDDEDDSQCSLQNETSTIELEQTVRLAFCQSPEPRPLCRRHRSVIRVIGEIHETGEAIQNILDTAVFCTCPNGFQRVSIEPWDRGYAFNYQCE